MTKSKYFSRCSPGSYVDRISGVRLRKDDGLWKLYVEKHERKAFVTTNLDDPYASFVIDGFRTMREARSFDFWPFLFSTGKPNIRKDGSVVSIPVRDYGTLKYYDCIETKEIRAFQLLLDLFG